MNLFEKTVLGLLAIIIAMIGAAIAENIKVTQADQQKMRIQLDNIQKQAGPLPKGQAP